MNKSLISVIVIAYNSSQYILETLESIKNQSYNNIELIISDDCSTDNTIHLCTQWLNINCERFTRYQVVRSKENTGITANCNRGVLASTGEFIKLIAADDLLLDNCLTDLFSFTVENKLQIAFSRAIPFNDSYKDNINDNINTVIVNDKLNYDLFFNKNNDKQYRDLLTLRVPLSIIVGCFYKRELLNEVGMYDESYEMMEDYPFLVKVSSKGYRFTLMDKNCVKYRLRLDNDSDNFKKSRRYNAHYNNLRKFRKEEILPRMKSKHMWKEIIYISLLMMLLHIEYNSNSNIINYITKVGRRLKQLFMK